MPHFTYKDPRLNMTFGGRAFVRAGEVLGSLVFLMFTIAALTSSVAWVRWLGIFMFLVAADKAIHYGQGDVPIPELIERKKINLAAALSPSARKYVHGAFDLARITHIDPALELASSLALNRNVRYSLGHAEIDAHNLTHKIKDVSGREEAFKPMHKKERVEYLEKILEEAFRIAEKRKQPFIYPIDIFYALPVAGGATERVFNIFNLHVED